MDQSKEQTDLIKKALVKIRDLKEALARKDEREPLAIIGMSCRFPGGVSSPLEFWKLLVENKEGLCPPPSDRWDHSLFYDSMGNNPNSIYLKECSFLKNPVRRFDAKFFGISPREAEEIDPQHRFLLELSWEAFENSGIIPAEIKEKNVGIFVGIISSEYASFERENYDLTPYYLTGTMNHMASGRIAYYYGTHGPAISIDTACSSSLVAFHLASRSLQSGESDIALVGGINLMINPYALASLCQLGALSSDGRCKPFEASADGYGRSEGGGFLVLKRLADAIQDQDNIFAIVKGSAVNHDGKSKGLTIPSREAQIKVMTQAFVDAKLDPSKVSYIEAHGTGTPVGDPLEMQAIETVFSKRAKDFPLVIGSVKANIGHSEASAGIASLIKTVLCMQNKIIPAQVNFNKLNPNITLDTFPAYIPTKNVPWNPPIETRIASINSFGFSGTNAHVIIEEALKKSAEQKIPSLFNGPPYFMVISAKSLESLQEYIGRYFQLIKNQSQETLFSQIQNASCLHRTHFKYRIVVQGNNQDELLQQLESIGKEKVATIVKKNPIGSYSVYVDETCMAKEEIRTLYTTYSEFRVAFDQCWHSFEPKPENTPEQVFQQEGLVDSTIQRFAALSSHFAFIKLLQSFGFPPPTLIGEKNVIDWILERYALPFQQENGSWLPKYFDEKKFNSHSQGDFLIILSGKFNVMKGLNDLKTILIEGYRYGYSIKWQKVLPGISLKHVDLPTYPFDNQTYWFKANKEKLVSEKADMSSNDHPLKGWEVVSPLSDYQHQFFVSPKNFKEINDTHGLLHIGQILELIFSMIKNKWNILPEQISLEDFDLQRALLVGEGLKIYGILTTLKEGASSFTLYTFDNYQNEWSIRIKGHIRHGVSLIDVKQKTETIEQQECLDPINDYPITRSQFYDSLSKRGVKLGSSVQWVEGVAVCSMRIDALLKSFDGSRFFNRGIFDALAQLFHLFLPKEDEFSRLIAIGWEKLRCVLPDPQGPFHAVIELHSSSFSDVFVGDVFLFDAEKHLCFFFQKLKMKKITVTQTASLSNEHQALINKILNAPDLEHQKKLCVQFVTILLSNLLNLDLQVQPEESLYEVGFDSIMGIDLVHQIKTAFQVEIDIEQLFENPSINTCSELILHRLQKKENYSHTSLQLSHKSWFKGSLQDKEALRLYCFPYGAGGASEYMIWEKKLSHFCQVVPIQLPGREERIEELPFDNIIEFINGLDAVFPDHNSVPFAFYGHSVGALMAYAYALHLQKKGRSLPTQLIVGAYSAPSIQPNPWFKTISERLRKMGIANLPTLENPLPDEMLQKVIVAFTEGLSKEYVEADPTFLKKVLPSVWADLHLVKSFCPSQDSQLNIPITALGGITDDRVSIQDIEAWSSMTNTEFSAHFLDGDHFFLRKNSQQQKVFEIIEKIIGQTV